MTPRTNDQIVEAFANETSRNIKVNSLFIEGNTIYSYGHHYPLAMHVTNDIVLINDTGYSPTTSKHIGLAMTYTRNKKQVFISECSPYHVLTQMEELKAKLDKARKPHIYAEQIQRLYNLFDENARTLLGFYILKHYNGFFSKNTAFEFMEWHNVPKSYTDTLGKIIDIYKSSLKYQ